MNNLFTDLNGIYATGLESTVKKTASHNTNSRLGQELEMQDFLNLMVESLKNQSIDDTADISDMLNQMVQMSVVTSINNINELITQSTNLSYAASLLGKEVTVAQQSGTQVQRITGTVTGTGMVNGQQAIFMGDRSFWMSDILSVGRLPGDETPSINPAKTAEQAEESAANGNTDADSNVDASREAANAGDAGAVNDAASAENSGTVHNAADTENSGAVQEGADAETRESVHDAASAETDGTAEGAEDAGSSAAALEAANASVWTGRSGVVSIDESMESDEEPTVEAAAGTASV